MLLPAMQNRVQIINPRCVEVRFIGDQNETTVKELLQSLDTLIDAQKMKREETGFLVDLSKIGKTTARARRATAAILQTRPFKRLGVYGGTTYVKYLAKLIISATRRDETARYFDTSEQARVWVS